VPHRNEKGRRPVVVRLYRYEVDFVESILARFGDGGTDRSVARP
jgi:hypothetical protein